jgi:hypothetical protein
MKYSCFNYTLIGCETPTRGQKDKIKIYLITKWVVRLWTRFIGSVVDSCGHGNEALDFIKG